MLEKKSRDIVRGITFNRSLVETGYDRKSFSADSRLEGIEMLEFV